MSRRPTRSEIVKSCRFVELHHAVISVLNRTVIEGQRTPNTTHILAYFRVTSRTMASLVGVTLLALTALVTWVISKLVPIIREIMLMRKAAAHLPCLPNHWLWGSLPAIKKVGRENLQFYVLEVAKRRKAKLLVLWRTILNPIILVLHSETVGQILRTSEPKNTRFGSGYKASLPWLGEGLLISTGRRWERNRKLLTPAFHFNILQPYVKIYNTAAEILLEKFQASAEKGASYEVFSPVALCTLDIMLRCAFTYDGGIQYQGVSHPYVQAVTRLSTLIEERYLKPLMLFDTLYDLTGEGREFHRLCDFVHKFTEGLIEKRREALANDKDLLTKRHLDFLDILLTVRDEDNVGLSKEDIRAEVDTFLFEGHDTTASAISWSLYSLAKYPDIQENVYREVSKVIGDKEHVEWGDLANLSYTTLFLKEVLRMYTPVPFIGRMLSKPLTIDGTELPAGMVVTISIYSLHHNPEVWENPEEFRPERFTEESFTSRDPYSFVPFSGGPRNCIGQNFALNEEKVVVSRIVNRFRIELDPDHEVTMLPDVVMRAKHGIKLKFTSRK